jgi:protein SCO1/2
MKRVLAIALVLIAVSIVAPATAGTPKLRGTVLTPPSGAPMFALHDQSGRLVRLADERGRWFVVTFLYTHCPDVCPLIANQLNAALRELPRLSVLAISVDPKGDTHRAVARFIRTHRLLPRFRYLTGTRGQLAPVWAGFHVAATPGASIVSHSAFALLVDPTGQERVLYDSQLTGADVVHDMKSLADR